jgi:hypothetical protein
MRFRITSAHRVFGTDNHPMIIDIANRRFQSTDRPALLAFDII